MPNVNFLANTRRSIIKLRLHLFLHLLPFLRGWRNVRNAAPKRRAVSDKIACKCELFFPPFRTCWNWSANNTQKKHTTLSSRSDGQKLGVALRQSVPWRYRFRDIDDDDDDNIPKTLLLLLLCRGFGARRLRHRDAVVPTIGSHPARNGPRSKMAPATATASALEGRRIPMIDVEDVKATIYATLSWLASPAAVSIVRR